MLCGEFYSTSPLSIVDNTRSPYFALLTLSQGMAAITADDEDIYLGKLIDQRLYFQVEPLMKQTNFLRKKAGLKVLAFSV